jgi:hypothetical protein
LLKEVVAVFRAEVQVDFCRCNIVTGGQRSMRKPRRNHSPAFKARVALELENAAAIFGGDVVVADGKQRIRDLQAKIEELTMENSFSYGQFLSTYKSTLNVRTRS